MKSFTSYLAVAAAALVTGGLVATAVTKPADTVKPTALKIPAATPPEQVRTQVVTRVIHRVHRVHVHPKAHHVAAAAAPAPAAPAPAPVVRAAPAPAPAVVPRRIPVATHIPTTTSAPVRQSKPTLTTRTSGHGTGSQSGGRDSEGGGDSGGDDRYEGGDD